MAEEVRETRTVNTDTPDRVVETTAPGNVVAQRIVWYVTGFIITMLALRIIFQLLGANQGNALVDFVYGLSGFFAAPFFGMFSYTPSYGVARFEFETLVAILIYALIGWGVAKLFTLNSTHTV